MESPDFDQIAQKICNEHGNCFGDDIADWATSSAEYDAMSKSADEDQRVFAATIAEQLRQVWNARGAADLKTLESMHGTSLDDEADAIRELDR